MTAKRITEARWRELMRRFGGGEGFDEWVSELANSLQSASLLSTRLRRELGSSTEIAVELEGSLDRAVRAVKRLQPGTHDER